MSKSSTLHTRHTPISVHGILNLVAAMESQIGQITEIPGAPSWKSPAEIFLARGGSGGGGGVPGECLRSCQVAADALRPSYWLQHDISKSSPEIAPKKFDLTVSLLLQNSSGSSAGDVLPLTRG